MENNYLAICGSRSLGLNLETSDFDIVYAAKERKPLPYEKEPNSHIIFHSSEAFIKKMLLNGDPHNCNAIWLQVYFPSKFLIDNDLSKYIIENREQIIYSMKDKVFLNYFTTANVIYYSFLSNKNMGWKKPAYGILYLDTLFRYATENISFEEAFRPNGDFKKWLLEIRQGNVPAEKVKNVLKNYLNEINSIEDFYKNNNNLNIENFYNDLIDLMEVRSIKNN